MASEFEYQRRFDYRRQKVDQFYKELDYIYRELKNVPENDESEGRQKDFVANELRRIEREIDLFIQDLYN